MDENQITDRPERARPETGIADGVPERGVPASPAPAAPPRRRKMRWWMPVAVVVLLGGAVGFFWWPAAGLFDQATRTLAIKAACLAIVLLLALWYIFFTGLWWRTRLLLSGIGLLLIVGFFVALRFNGATGDMGFRYTWRWQAPPDAALAGQSDDTVLPRPLAVTIRPDDFPQFLGPNRDAVVHGVHLDRDWTAHPPREVWRKPVGAGWSAFAVAGPLAVTQEQRGGREMVVARDRDTGDVLWQHGNADRFSELMGGDGPRATPTIAGGKVFALGATGVLDCLDASTGKLLWTHDTLRESGEQNLQWGKSCSPLVIEDLGLVVVSLGSGGPGGGIAAYDVHSGGRKWVAGTDKASYASPMLTTLAGQRQIVMVNDKTVTGHDPAEGTVLWRYDWGTAPAKASQPPVLNGDSLLLTGGYGLKGVLLQVKRDGSTMDDRGNVDHRPHEDQVYDARRPRSLRLRPGRRRPDLHRPERRRRHGLAGWSRRPAEPLRPRPGPSGRGFAGGAGRIGRSGAGRGQPHGVPQARRAAGLRQQDLEQPRPGGEPSLPAQRPGSGVLRVGHGG